MKLRNKKTGEIIDIKDVFTESDNFPNHYVIRNEWEDYEEPEGWWFIDRAYEAHATNSTLRNLDADKEIGNYFSSKEEAEEAVEKLKAWKRLKDSEFRLFIGGKTCEYKSNKHFGSVFFEISKDMLKIYDDNVGFYKDLDLLFGGEK